MGIAEGPCWSIMTALIEESSSPSRRGRNIGIVVSAGALVGLAVATDVDHASGRELRLALGFFVSGAPGILMGAADLEIRQGAAKTGNRGRERSHQPAAAIISRSCAIAISGCCCVGRRGFYLLALSFKCFRAAVHHRSRASDANHRRFSSGRHRAGKFHPGFSAAVSCQIASDASQSCCHGRDVGIWCRSCY